MQLRAYAFELDRIHLALSVMLSVRRAQLVHFRAQPIVLVLQLAAVNRIKRVGGDEYNCLRQPPFGTAKQLSLSPLRADLAHRTLRPPADR